MATTAVTPTGWNDAFLAVCVDEPKYIGRADFQAVVKEFVKVVSLEDDETAADYVETLKNYIKRGETIRLASDKIDVMKKSLPTCFGLLPTLAVFNKIGKTELTDCVDSIKHTLERLSYRVGKGTSIESGEITLGLEVLNLTDDALLFCIAHEVGHAVCAQVQTKDQNYTAFREAIFSGWNDHKGIHLQEHFADCFAALVMLVSSKDHSQILDATKLGVASEGLTGDHPADAARVAEVQELLLRMK